jgi:hypothetical protein
VLYLYDNALVEDMKRTIDPEGEANPNVLCITVDNYQSTLAQLQNDRITYPIILFIRDDDIPVKKDQMNFTRYKKGVPAGIDPKTNMVYFERILPLDLRYTIQIISTNVADRDEIAREIWFKYESEYYLHIETPYEVKRRLRFGMHIDRDFGIKNDSSSSQYLSEGKLYTSTMELLTDGCVLLYNTPRHLKREVMDTKHIQIENPSGSDAQ